jgi:hypothetical protein
VKTTTRAAYRPLTYLASPYTHPEDLVREARFQLVTAIAAKLIRAKGWNVFSPITHSHPLHQLGGLAGDWKFWEKIDTEYLRISARLVVLKLDGWKTSTGVQAEIAIAKRLKIPIRYIDPKTFIDYPISNHE